jgi:hypothetical protein
MVSSAQESVYQIIDKKYPTNNLIFGPALEAEESFPQTRRPTVVALPYLDGEYDPFGDEAWPMGGRDITFKFMVQYNAAAGLDNFTKVWDKYSKVLMHGRALTIVTKTALTPLTFRYSEGKCVSMPKASAADQISHASIEATIHMTRPLMYDNTPNGWSVWDQTSPPLSWDQSGLKWDFNPDDFAINTSFVSHTITDNGSADDLSPTIHFYTPPVGGTFPGQYLYVYNYYVLNRSGNPTLFILDLSAAGMGPNEEYVVNTGQWSVRHRVGAVTSAAYDRIILPPGQDDWFRVNAGSNTLIIQASGVGTYNARMSVIWTQKYY